MKFLNPDQKNRSYVYGFTVVAMTIFLGMSFFIGKNNNIFKKKINFTISLDNALGLHARPPIFFRGFEVGRVISFKLKDDNKIKVKFYVYEEYHEKITNKSVLQIKRNPITGIITDFDLVSPLNGNGDYNKLSAGSSIYSAESIEGKTIIANEGLYIVEPGVNGIVRKTNNILHKIEESRIIEKLDTIIVDVNAALDLIKKSLGNADEFLNKEGIGKKERTMWIATIADNAISITNELNETLGMLNGILKEVHGHKDEISPLITKSKASVEKVNELLEGIHNNSFIRSNLAPKKMNVNGIEIDE